MDSLFWLVEHPSIYRFEVLLPKLLDILQFFIIGLRVSCAKIELSPIPIPKRWNR